MIITSLDKSVIVIDTYEKCYLLQRWILTDCGEQQKLPRT